MKISSRIKIILGPLAALIILLFTDLDPENPMVTRMAAVTTWIAIWWLTEAVHLAQQMAELLVQAEEADAMPDRPEGNPKGAKRSSRRSTIPDLDFLK